MAGTKTLGLGQSQSIRASQHVRFAAGPVFSCGSGARFGSTPSSSSYIWPVSRRSTVTGILAGPILFGCSTIARGVESLQSMDIVVSRDSPFGFSTLREALAAASPGATIRVSAGTYRERLDITQPVTLEAYPKGAQVSVIWETSQPYEPVVYSSTPGTVLKGLTLRHASPSIANNYAVFLQGAGTVLEGCNISSTTGSGIGMEGGSLTLQACTISRCQGHGLALFPSLEGDASDCTDTDCTGTRCTVSGCTLADNRRNGVLSVEGTALRLINNMVTSNGGWGLEVGGQLLPAGDNVIVTNGQGALRGTAACRRGDSSPALDPTLNKIQGRILCPA